MRAAGFGIGAGGSKKVFTPLCHFTGFLPQNLAWNCFLSLILIGKVIWRSGDLQLEVSSEIVCNGAS